jgi:hypothetical protein
MKRSIMRSVVAVMAALALRASAGDDAAKVTRLWNPATVTTVSGAVEAVERIEMGDDWSCVRLRMRTAEGPILVRVGPDWYLTERKVTFAPGEQLRITGSRVTFSGEPTLIAAAIARGKVMILLRDEAGHPAWAGK